METGLPIYYGTREVYDIFHEDSFVFYDIDDPDQALDLIQHLESNQTEYERRLSAPVLKNGADTVETYFSFLPTLGRGTLNKSIRNMMGLPPLDNCWKTTTTTRKQTIRKQRKPRKREIVTGIRKSKLDNRNTRMKGKKTNQK